MSKKKCDKINIIDIEATCWEHNLKPPDEESEIIEIGISVLDIENLKIESTDSILVKPLKSKVSPFCVNLTTLTQEQVDKGITFPEACKKLKKEYQSVNRVWASWGDYDRVQFERNSKMYQVKYPFGRRHFSIKTMFALFSGHTKESGMTEALDYFNLELEGTLHRGDDDSRNIAKICSKMLQKYRF